MRKRIYEIIEISQNGDKISAIYDYVMMATILISLIPLAFKHSNNVFDLIDKCTVSIFIADYLLRELTADRKLDKGVASFILYPFTPMAIIDLLCILPSFSVLSSGFRVLKLFRLMRTFRVFRAFKMIRYSKSISIIANVIRDQKRH